MDQGFAPTTTFVDGIPVVSAPLEPVATATLFFTVGSRDETPRTAGVAHLIEHVVMRRVGPVSAPHNAMTDADSIRFFVSGSSAEITDFLRRVCEAVSWLVECGEDDVAPERRTIGTELGLGGEEGAIGPLFLRYGPIDIGLMDLGQPPHRTLPVEAVHEYARRYLHRGNAAVTITGVVPDDLRLPLPDGERRPPRTTPPTIRTDLPGWSVAAGGPVVINVELRAAPACGLLTQSVIQAFLLRELRVERHLVYSPGTLVLTLDDDLASLTIVLDPAQGDAPAALDAAIRGLRAMAESGPDPRDLDHARESIRSGAAHTAARVDWLMYVASSEARGRGHEVSGYDEEVAKVLAVESDQVRDALADALPSVMVTVAWPDFPADVPEALGIPPMTPPREHVPERFGNVFTGALSQAFALLSPRFGKGLRGYSLFVSDKAIAEVGPDGVFEAPLAEVVLAGRRGDGTLNLVLSSGRMFFVRLSDWRDQGGRLARAIESIPAELFYERSD